MLVRVIAFAGAREALGRSEVDLELPSPSRVRDAWRGLLERYPGLASTRDSTRVAVNGEVAADDAALRDGDELALLPPVGGG